MKSNFLTDIKIQISIQSFAAVSLYILLCLPVFNMTGSIVKPIIISVIGSIIICTGSLFSKYREKIISNALLLLMLFWFSFALVKQFFLQLEAGFVFEWIYFFYFDKLLMLGIIWFSSVLFFLIKRIFDVNDGIDYLMFYKNSGRAFLLFYIFLLVFSFVLIRLQKGVYPFNFIPFRTLKEYASDWESIPYEVFMMFCGNLFYFSPLGYIFAIKLRNVSKVKKNIILFLFPLIAFTALEFSQYFLQNGYCEFDDMMMNSIGFWIGSFLCPLTDLFAYKLSKGRVKTFWI